MRKESQLATTVITRELSNRDLDIVAGRGAAPAPDIEQVLKIGSQSSGAGAGKATFGLFSITRH